MKDHKNQSALLNWGQRTHFQVSESCHINDFTFGLIDAGTEHGRMARGALEALICRRNACSDDLFLVAIEFAAKAITKVANLLTREIVNGD